MWLKEIGVNLDWQKDRKKYRWIDERSIFLISFYLRDRNRLKVIEFLSLYFQQSTSDFDGHFSWPRRPWRITFFAKEWTMVLFWWKTFVVKIHCDFKRNANFFINVISRLWVCFKTCSTFILYKCERNGA